MLPWIDHIKLGRDDAPIGDAVRGPGGEPCVRRLSHAADLTSGQRPAGSTCRLAPLTMTPNCGCTMRFCAGHGASSPTIMSWTSDAGAGRRPEVLNRLDSAAAARALGRRREMLAAHMSGNGVWFDSRAWIVTARRH